jgi:hypothetical protein
MISEQGIGNHMDGRGGGIISDASTAFLLKGQNKTTEISVRPAQL